MNYEFFIAKRIIGSKAYKSSVSAPIIKIGIAAIAIGIVVMLIAIATGLGLQKKVREKAKLEKTKRSEEKVRIFRIFEL